MLYLKKGIIYLCLALLVGKEIYHPKQLDISGEDVKRLKDVIVYDVNLFIFLTGLPFFFV